MGRKVALAPTIIEGEEFEGNELLTAEEWVKLVTPNFFNICSTFLLNWNEGPTVVLIADLSNDCSKIENVGVMLEGKVFNTREKSVSTSKIWNFKQTKLRLKFDPVDLSIFRFLGRMWSELVDGAEFKTEFINEGDEELEIKDLCAQGFTGFTLRSFLMPISVYQAKVSIILYPCQKDILLRDYPMATRPEFPGVLLSSITADMAIQKEVITDKKIGCPILPVIRTAAPIELAAIIPTPAEAASKISALFCDLRLPEVKTTVKSLWERMAAVKVGGEDCLETVVPEARWPTIALIDPPGNKGSILYL